MSTFIPYTESYMRLSAMLNKIHCESAISPIQVRMPQPEVLEMEEIGTVLAALNRLRFANPAKTETTITLTATERA